MKTIMLITTPCIRLVGNIVKCVAYIVHFILPDLRFTIPTYSSAKITSHSTPPIPNTLWQTNYSNQVTLPLYINYLFNRLMTLDHNYYYVSTEERAAFIRQQAPTSIFEAYKKLTDGAAQADLWRAMVLYHHGGTYIDFDATLVWPLSLTLKNIKSALYIKIKKNCEFTNFFLSSEPNNSDLSDLIDLIVNNIEHYDVNQGVYGTTGPGALNNVLVQRQVQSRRRRFVCIQGAFTNEHFQYLDKPRGKWTHMDPKNLIKK